MRQAFIVLLLAQGAPQLALGAPGSPTLSDGVISYTEEGGERKTIDVCKPCSDLWVSPDESIIAFIGIDEGPVEHVGPFTTVGPNILASRIYIAMGTDHYRPVRVNVGPVVVDGTEWRVLRHPSLGPDLKTLYFEIPYAATSWLLMSITLPAGPPQALDGTTIGYCPMWGGRYSGDLLMMRRRFPDPAEIAAGIGVQNPCYLRDSAGSDREVAEEGECFDFAAFAKVWSAKTGGSCTLGMEYVEAHGAPVRNNVKP